MLNALWFLIASRFDRRYGIFWFNDGRKYRRIDCLHALGQFYALKDFDWDNAPAELKSTSSVGQLAAVGKIAESVRLVFGVPEFEDGGLTDIGCVDLMTAFRMHLGDVKKNGSLWPISSPSQVSEPASLDVPPLPTSGLDSSSTPPESPPAPLGSPVGPIPHSTLP